MPVIRATIASNVNRSKKAPLLIKIPEQVDDDHARYGHCPSLVRQEARKKLHLKQALNVFTTDGRKIDGEQAWREVLKNDVVLIIAGHEDYVGATTYKEPATEGRNDDSTNEVNRDCPVEVLAKEAAVDPMSVVQLETTARTLPGIVHATGQPDLHPGTKFPIGAVFVSKDWIHPPLIGGDIGCGMAWYKTTLSRSKVEDRKGQKIADSLRGLEGPWRTPDCRQIWLEGEDHLGDDGFYVDSPCAAGEEWDKSIGTIGAGNHFAELQVVEEVNTVGDEELSLREGDVLLLVHSGSRGYGAEVLKRHTNDGRTSSIRTSDPKCTDYLMDHERARQWATRNRDLIALRFLSLLEPGMPVWDQAMRETDGPSDAINIRHARSEIQARKVVDICHNALTRTAWPPSATADTQTQHYIHRKGAAPTSTASHNTQPPTSPQPQTLPPLLPLLPLPGSRATPTLILHPLNTPTNNFGLTNALSVAHGAGRALSRAKAAVYVSEKYAGRSDDLLRGDSRHQQVYLQQGKGKSTGTGKGETVSGRDAVKAMEGRGGGGGGGGGGTGGTWVVCEDRQLVWEEAGEAYKDVWAVGGDLVAAGCAEVVGWARPVVSYKVRKE